MELLSAFLSCEKSRAGAEDVWLFFPKPGGEKLWEDEANFNTHPPIVLSISSMILRNDKNSAE
jgi:hypothetical protein